MKKQHLATMKEAGPLPERFDVSAPSPQAFRRMIPLSTTTFRPLEIFTGIALVYFVLCTALSYVAGRLERRLAIVD